LFWVVVMDTNVFSSWMWLFLRIGNIKQGFWCLLK
jgi:hypothetical protein